jgi:hypothetical protein
VYIISFIDLASRYVEAFPSPNQTTQAVATCLVEGVIARHGLPKEILSDQGSCFTSSEFKMLVEQMLGSKQTLATSYAHWSSGAIERLHRDIGEFLKMFQTQYPESEWDRLLPFAVASYNTATHSIIGVSPFTAIFGRPYRSIIAPSSLISDRRGEAPGLSWITETAARIKSIKEFSTSKEKASRTEDPSNTTISIKPGSTIRQKAQGAQTKTTTYLEPKVVLKSTPHRVTIAAPTEKNPLRTTDVHIRNLKKVRFAPNSQSTPNRITEPSTTSSTHQPSTASETTSINPDPKTHQANKQPLSENNQTSNLEQKQTQQTRQRPNINRETPEFNQILEIIDEVLNHKTLKRSYLTRVANKEAVEWSSWLPVETFHLDNGDIHPALKTWSARTRNRRHTRIDRTTTA